MRLPLPLRRLRAAPPLLQRLLPPTLPLAPREYISLVIHNADADIRVLDDSLTVAGAVNPEADPTGTSATSVPSGNGGATAVGAANEGILGSNGALASVKFSASALFVTVLGAVAAVAL